MEADDLLCSRNACPEKGLVGRAQWKINQLPSLKRERASLEGASGSSGCVGRKPSGIPAARVWRPCALVSSSFPSQLNPADCSLLRSRPRKPKASLGGSMYQGKTEGRRETSTVTLRSSRDPNQIDPLRLASPFTSHVSPPKVSVIYFDERGILRRLSAFFIDSCPL